MDSDDDYHIEIDLGEGRESADATALADAVKLTLRREGRRSCRISVAIVDDAGIARLHERYLGRSGPTDCLSFDLRDDPGEWVAANEEQPNGRNAPPNSEWGHVDVSLVGRRMSDWHTASDESRLSTATTFVVAALNVEGTTASRIGELHQLAVQVRSCMDESGAAADQPISEVAEKCRSTLGYAQ